MEETLEAMKSEMWRMEDRGEIMDNLAVYITMSNNYHKLVNNYIELHRYMNKLTMGLWGNEIYDMIKIDLWDKGMSENKKLDLITDEINHDLTKAHYQAMVKNKQILKDIMNGKNEVVNKVL